MHMAASPIRRPRSLCTSPLASEEPVASRCQWLSFPSKLGLFLFLSALGNQSLDEATWKASLPLVRPTLGFAGLGGCGPQPGRLPPQALALSLTGNLMCTVPRGGTPAPLFGPSSAQASSSVHFERMDLVRARDASRRGIRVLGSQNVV